MSINGAMPSTGLHTLDGHIAHLRLSPSSYRTLQTAVHDFAGRVNTRRPYLQWSTQKQKLLRKVLLTSSLLPGIRALLSGPDKDENRRLFRSFIYVVDTEMLRRGGMTVSDGPPSIESPAANANKEFGDTASHPKLLENMCSTPNSDATQVILTYLKAQSSSKCEAPPTCTEPSASLVQATTTHPRPSFHTRAMRRPNPESVRQFACGSGRQKEKERTMSWIEARRCHLANLRKRLIKAEAEGRDVTTLKRNIRNASWRIHFAEQSLANFEERWDAKELRDNFCREQDVAPVKAPPSTDDLSSAWCVVC